MNILKFIKSLFVKDKSVTIVETTTAAPIASASPVVPKRKKAVKRKKNVNIA